MLGLGAIWYISTVRLKLSARDDLQLVKPAGLRLVGWIGIWLVWMMGTDWLMNWRGPWDFSPWASQPLWLSIVRVVSVCLVGPLLEELLFRGLLLVKLGQWGFSKGLSVLLLSAIWALIHIDYEWSVIGLLFLNGILLTLSLWQSRSLLVPIVLHMLWNLYAIW